MIASSRQAMSQRTLSARAAPVSLAAGSRCMTIASSSARDLADSLGLISTDDAAEADLLIIAATSRIAFRSRSMNAR